MPKPILHFVPDEYEPARLMSTLLDALAPGSYLTATTATGDYDPPGMAAAERAYRQSGVPLTARSADEFAKVAFSGLDLVDPGLVPVSQWRPNRTGPRPLPAECSVYGAVARKP